MQLISVVSALAVQLSLVTASRISAGLSKRAAVTNASLIAYGTDTEGWPVAYGLDDGTPLFPSSFLMYNIVFEANSWQCSDKLYITANPNDTTLNLEPLTWDM